jgi:hypothetical protein
MNLNTQTLKEIADSNQTAQAMFTAWALRERNRARLDLRRFRKFLEHQGFKIDPSEYYATFIRLVQAGAGTLETSFRGNPRYFYWKTSEGFSVRLVGQVGLGQAVMTPVITQRPVQPQPKKVAPKPRNRMVVKRPRTVNGTRVMVSVQTASGETVNLSKDDIDMIAKLGKVAG